MAAAITAESLDLGKALVDEKDALVTYKRLADKAGFDEKTATLLVSAIGCRMVLILIMAPVVVMTLEDNEDVSECRQTKKSSLP